jgi:hypothetical protein
MVSFAQPGDQPPAPPANTPRDQPSGDRPNGFRPDGVRGQPGAGRRGEAASVRQGMSMMNRAVRTLKTHISDAAKKDDNLKALNDLERGCVAAKGSSPDRVLNRLDEAKRAEATTQFRRALIQVLEKAARAETAVMDGNNAEAAKLIEEIEKLRDDSHKALGVRDDDEGPGRGGEVRPRGDRGGDPDGR